MKSIVALAVALVATISSAAPVVYYVNGASNPDDSTIDGSFAAFTNAISKKYGKVPSANIYVHKIYLTKSESPVAVLCQKTLAELSLKNGVGSVYNDADKYVYLSNLGSYYSSDFLVPGFVAPCHGAVLPATYVINRTRALYEAVRRNIDNGVVLVGHSQGNFVIEAVLGLLFFNKYDVSKVRLVNIASMVPTVHKDYVNASQDNVLYSDQVISFYSLNIPVNLLWGGLLPVSNSALCLDPCTRAATNEELVGSAKADPQAHGIVTTYLNQRIYDFKTKSRLPFVLANKVNSAFFALNGRLATKISKVTSPTAMTSSGHKNNTALGFSVHAGEVFYVKSSGLGFDGREVLRIDGVACDDQSIVRGAGYFVQKCVSGDNASIQSEVVIKDALSGLYVEVDTDSRYIEILAPIIVPVGVTASPTASAIRVTWGSVAGVSGYAVYRDGTQIGAVGPVTTYDDSTAVAGTNYCYRVRAIQGSVLSSFSEQSCATLAASVTLASPTGVNAVSTATGMQVTWNTVVGATSYRISRGGSTLTTVAGGASSNYLDTGVVNGTNYCYTITAISTNTTPATESAASTQVCTTYNSGASNALLAPTGLVAAQYGVSGTKGIRLTWDAVATADSYLIYRNGAFLAATGATTNFLDLSSLGLTTGVSYCYKVRAQRVSELSPESDWGCSLAP